MIGTSEALVGVVAAGICAVLLASPLAAEAQDKKDAGSGKEKKVKSEPGIEAAALAMQLALEGQKRRSPLLLLAAAELLGGLKEGKREAKGVESKTEGPAAKSD